MHDFAMDTSISWKSNCERKSKLRNLIQTRLKINVYDIGRVKRATARFIDHRESFRRHLSSYVLLDIRRRDFHSLFHRVVVANDATHPFLVPRFLYRFQFLDIEFKLSPRVNSRIRLVDEIALPDRSSPRARAKIPGPVKNNSFTEGLRQATGKIRRLPRNERG